MRSQIYFDNKQHQTSLQIENFVQFDARTTEKSLSKIGTKPDAILTKFCPYKIDFILKNC